MSTLPALRAPYKSARSVRLLCPPDADGNNAEIEMTIAYGRKTHTWRYWIDRVPCVYGRGFLVEKEGDGINPNPEYHVLLADQESTCECLGFLKFGKCKHLAALQRLVELRKL